MAANLLWSMVLVQILGGMARAENQRPNVIFIMADDLGYGDLGCYGGQLIQTPNLNRMADEGMRFTNCYAGSPVCAPSRSVLMTGLHTGHTTVRGNFGLGGVVGLGGGAGRIPLRDEDVTLAEVMKQAGYATGMIGKWGLGEPGTTGEPLRQGFDQWFGYLNQRRAHSYYPDFLWLGNHRFELTGNANGNQQIYSHDLFTGFAMNFIREHAEQPFFLYLPFTIPHDKFEVPDLGPYQNKPWSEQEKTYAAMVTRMDTDIGRMVALLEELDLTERTMIFFCSDNGAANRYDGRFDSSGPLHGRKRDMYEGGIRTPMLARCPGTIPAGSTSDLPWYFADVMPTLADVASVALENPTDGVSVLPTLAGKKQDLSERYLYWEFFEAGYQQAARRGRWKCVRLESNKPLELYDLETDPGETTDVAEKHPDVVEQFETYLANASTASEFFPRQKIEGK